ncbi:MAG: TonB-dependent receptor plug domain-containing protein [Hyphomonas sp.]
MLRFTTLAALATASSLTALAQAADLSETQAEDRQDVVFVEGLRPTAIDDTIGAIITVPTDVRSTINPVDSLRAAPGVSVSRSGSLGGLTQVRIRGAEANHTLTTYEGIEISDPVNGETDFGLISALPVGRIDVLRGPASSIHGSDAIGGVVALRASETDSLVSGHIEGGAFDTLNGSIAVNASPSDTSRLLVSVTGATTRGVDTSGLDAEKDGSDARSVQITGKTTLANWDISGLGLMRHSTSEFDSDTDFDGLLNNVDQETESNQNILGINAARDYGQLDHTLSASYNSVERENTANGAYTGETEGTRTKVSWSPSFDILNDGTHRLTGLTEWEREEYERQSTDTLFGDPNQSVDFTSQALAAEYRYSADALTLTASARQDFNDSQFDDATTWRVGGAYDVLPSLRVRATAGEAVKNPTFTELFGFFPASFIGNPNLEPESSLGWDIGVDHAFPLASGNVTLSATYFEADLENEIYTVFNPDFTSSPANRTTDSDRSGVEIAAAAEFGAFSLNAQYTNTTSEAAGVDEIRVPEDTASLSADWSIEDVNQFGDGRLSIAFDYVGKQGDTDFGTFSAVTIDSYTLASARFELPFAERASFTVRGENLFDETSTDVFGYHAPGAGIYVGLTFR